MAGSRVSRLLVLLALSQAVLGFGFGFGKSAARCDLRRMLQCMGDLEAAGVEFEQRLQLCESSVCPGGDVPSLDYHDVNGERARWNEEDMLSAVFIQEENGKSQLVKVAVDSELCTKDRLAAFEFSTGFLLPFQGCAFDTAEAECTCSAQLPVTGLYVTVDKEHKPRSRRLPYLKRAWPANSHNVWMEGAHRSVLIVLSTIAFIGNFIFLVQVFWVA
jgi:hypothetical protein